MAAVVILFLILSVALLPGTIAWVLLPSAPRKFGRTTVSLLQAAAEGNEVTVRLNGGEEKKIYVKENEFLLLALEANKIKQRFVCRTGTCSACAVRVTNGNSLDFFEHEDPDMVSSAKSRQGFSLSCVAFVKKAGAVIEVNQETAYDEA